MLKPLNDMILTKPMEPEQVTASGLHVVSQTTQVKRAEVIAVGEGKYNEYKNLNVPLQVKEGDTILYNNYVGTELNSGGDKLVLLRESEVLAKES